MTFHVLDLFAGAGGLTAGFHTASGPGTAAAASRSAGDRPAPPRSRRLALVAA